MLYPSIPKANNTSSIFLLKMGLAIYQSQHMYILLAAGAHFSSVVCLFCISSVLYFVPTVGKLVLCILFNLYCVYVVGSWCLLSICSLSCLICIIYLLLVAGARFLSVLYSVFVAGSWYTRWLVHLIYLLLVAGTIDS